ncbi:MAG: hypothetical protein Q9M43_04550 [Sulfurimonas sp.]|nr:hypothetical protein [Sulfurimonas sp.]
MNDLEGDTKGDTKHTEFNAWITYEYLFIHQQKRILLLTISCP